MPFIRSAYNYDRDKASVESGLACEPEGGAKQEFKDECDINVLLRRFNVTGQLPSGVRMPTFGDFEVVNDFHSAANAIAEARESFDVMPAEVRRRFNNDPADFVAFCSDSSNREEAVKLGLVPPDEVKLPKAAEPLAGAASGTAASPPKEGAASGATAPGVGPGPTGGTLST